MLLLAAAVFGQRPIQHDDYDSWNSILSPKVSDNGRFFLYGLFPQAGNGYVVIRDLNTDAEIRQPAGERPAPPPPDFSGGEEGPPPARGVTAEFTSDGLFAVFQTFPSAEARQKARQEKAKEAPAGDLVLANLATGQVWRVSGVKSFRLPEESSDRIAYLTAGGKLFVRSLSDQSETSFPEATEFRLTNDGKTIMFLGKKGAYRADLPAGEAVALIPGDTKCSKLTAAKDRFAFVGNSQLHVWSPGEAAASAAAENASEYGPVSFSDDGNRIFFGLRPDTPPASPARDEAVFDLWHYRDDYIQPMQRVRAKTEREWSERAVFLVNEKKVVPLSGGLLTRTIPSRDGRVAVGLADRPYRRLRERDTDYADVYAVNTADGSKKLLEKQARTTPTLSPDGRYAVGFVGKQWVCWELASGTRRELTGITGRAFFREDYDSPQQAPAYGPAAWTRDSQWVLIPDRFDVWAFRPDGSMARNFTDGFGRREKTELRVVNVREDPKNPGIDPASPILLRGENVETRESGFFRDSLDASVQPEKLTMGPVNHRAPLAAKKADVFLVAPSKFNEFPDWHVTNGEMKAFRKVTSANPRAAEFAFGASRLIRYRNGDGKELSAALFTPAGFDPKKKYPMLVYIYEKLSQTVNDFVEPRPNSSINVSYYTSNGYVVLMPDIVYTVGYPGASALKCVVAAVQRAIDMGFVDPERVGIQGHSWGGYQIAYMITQTNIFRAAAPGALVANMISAYDGIRWGPGIPRQFQYEKAQSRIGGTPWEYPMRYIENSPIFMADRIKTPVLMVHNDADDAVPWYQGIEFYLALRRLDKEVYFFNYNGEGHGLRNRANQKDYTVRLQQFFDHYLKDAPMPAWMRDGRRYVDKTGAAEPSAAPPSDQ
jgi:acetyl esterase/lipase